jgi:hypothetical protein
VSNTYCPVCCWAWWLVAWHNLLELQQFLNFTYWILKSFGIALAQSNTTTILENKL